MKKTLLLILSERISEWINKGEVLERYYNPGNFFDEVHLLTLNEDQPNQVLVQKMFGKAKLHIHHYPEPQAFFTKTLGWQPLLIKTWATGALEIIKNINPHIIRCHGAHLNTYIASKAKKKFGIPYVISLHINPDENYRKSAVGVKNKLIAFMLKKIEKIGLLNADLVMPVYKPIIPYLERLGVKKFRVCYNVINGDHIQIKNNYAMSKKIKALCVGRLFHLKNPINLIKAVQNIDNLDLTLIGTGEYQKSLKQFVSQNKLNERIHFIDSIENSVLCSQLSKYDFVALHTEHFELSKVMIESFLSGMPVLLNYRESGDQVPELTEDNCLRVFNTVESYEAGIKKIINNEKYRKTIGKNALKFAQSNCSPIHCENVYVKIYQEFSL